MSSGTACVGAFDCGVSCSTAFSDPWCSNYRARSNAFPCLQSVLPLNKYKRVQKRKPTSLLASMLVCGCKARELLRCASCRASCHPCCFGAGAERGRWTCRDCSSLPRYSRVTLTGWSLEVSLAKDGRLIPLVRGTLNEDGPRNGAHWRTSEIVYAVTGTTLVTRTRSVVELRGFMSKRLARRVNLPSHLIKLFKLGFPDIWLPLVRYCLRGFRQPWKWLW